MTAPFHPLAHALSRPRAEITGFEESAGGLYKWHVEVAVTNGECTVPVAFPVQFTQKPSFTYSAELAPNQRMEDRNFPTASAVIHDWATTQRSDTRFPLYNGATVIFVATGALDQVLIFQLHFEAKALAGPI